MDFRKNFSFEHYTPEEFMHFIMHDLVEEKLKIAAFKAGNVEQQAFFKKYLAEGINELLSLQKAINET